MSKDGPRTVWRRAFFLGIIAVAVIAIFLGITALLILRGVIPEEFAKGNFVLFLAFLGTLLLGGIQPMRKMGEQQIFYLFAPVGILLLSYTVLAFLVLPEGPELSGFLRGAVAMGLGFCCGTMFKINKIAKGSKKRRRKIYKK